MDGICLTSIFQIWIYKADVLEIEARFINLL